jgi:hypothetical protein
MKKTGVPLKFMGFEEFSKFIESENKGVKPLIKGHHS